MPTKHPNPSKTTKKEKKKGPLGRGLDSLFSSSSPSFSSNSSDSSHALESELKSNQRKCKGQDHP